MTLNELRLILHFVNVIIPLENGIRHLLNIFEKLFYLGQFWVILGVRVRIRLHNKNELSRLPVSSLKVSLVGVVLVGHPANYLFTHQLLLGSVGQ